MQTVTNLGLSFWINKQRTRPEGVPVYCRITILGQRAELSTGKYVDENRWSHGRVIPKCQADREVNQFLANYEAIVNRHFDKMMELQLPITAELLKNRVLGKTEKKLTFLEAFEWMIKECEELVKVGKRAQATCNKIGYTKDKVKTFMKNHMSISDINVEHIKPDFVHDFSHYLLTKDGQQNNSAMKYIKISRQVLTFAISKHKLSQNPFASFKCSYIEPEIEILEMHEILNMWNTEMPDIELEEIRDIYIFCIFTGYAFKDSMDLDEDCIFLGINGSKFISKDRQKSDQREMVMLLDIPLQIIEKYKNHKCRTIQKRLLPQHYNSHFNKYLKVVASACGIKKHLTHHTARHTFATTVTLENDVPLETVQKMLGHKSIKSTMRYAKVTKKKMHNNMTELATKLQPMMSNSNKLR
jgi:site-specific recombinase XerD